MVRANKRVCLNRQCSVSVLKQTFPKRYICEEYIVPTVENLRDPRKSLLLVICNPARGKNEYHNRINHEYHLLRS